MRNISFSMTTPQVRARTKTVTRRMGWALLMPGDLMQACEKCQGLKTGEKIVPISIIRVLSVRREPLSAITAEDVVREGFPNMTRDQFIEFFCEGHKGCKRLSIVTRIEFSYVDHPKEK